MRASIAACSSSSTAASAFSISVSTSPMPRIRDAIRSGWKYSSWSSFSPTETSLTGLPVTARTESAAPPRASPSSFVSTTPSKAIRSKNASADVDGLLAGHRVEDEQDVRRLRRVPDARELLHQLLVDVQAAGGVDDDDVVARLAGRVEPVLDDLDRILRVAAVDGDLDLAAELLELVDRGRPLQVGRDQRRLLPVLAQQQRELGGRRRLAGALEAGEQDHGRRLAEREPRVAGAHQRRQLLVDDLDDLLPGVEALEHVLAGRALAHLRDEVLHDLEVDVGLEQREPDLAHRLRDRLLVEASLAAEVAEGVLELV